ncbi:IS4 family transposase [Alloalcanivorax xenomutans]|uniref:IS4 family transposase n=1 Tax=Alloalcanivorax xenomutans TaxID=1094342 RepID=UPI003BA84289
MDAKQNRFQQQAIKRRLSRQDAIHFFNLLTSAELFDVLESLLPEHRERLFPPTETLAMFLSQVMQADRSCQRVVNEAAVARWLGGRKACSTFTGGYCKARQRLPLELVSSLACATGALTNEKVPNDWLWQGRPVRIVDGTTVTLPDTPANQEDYPQQRSQKPGLGFPLCRIVAVTCLASGAVLNAAMGPYAGKGASEHTLFRSLLPGFNAGDILLGDGLYGSYVILADCLARGVDVVFEQNGARKLTTDFRKGKRLGHKDHLIRISKPCQRPDWMSLAHYQALPDDIVLREVALGGKVLITTLYDPARAPRQALKALYRSRWHVELDIRHIKTTLGMETLSCKTPEMAEKELWVYFLAYNLVRLLMVPSAVLAKVLPRTLSFKHALQCWQAWYQQLLSCHTTDDLTELFRLIGQQRVGNRPGRIEPRAVKRRPKPLPLLTRTRHEARAWIRQHGHPPKQRPWNKTASGGKKASVR